MSSTKNRFAFFKGEIVPIEEARIGVMTAALNYGLGVFEGIRAYWCDRTEELYLFRLREHYERFLRNARVLLMDLPYSADRLSEITVDLIRREGYRTDTYIRPLAYKSSEVIGVKLHNLDCDATIFAIPFGAYIDKPGGCRLRTSSWRRIDDNAIPARGKFVGAYVNSALAKTDAVTSGYDDALLLNADGHVAEASAANLFIVREGALLTPPVTDNILEGIRRMTFMQLAADRGIPCRERSIDRSEIYHAEEAFLCGTGVGIVPVIELDDRPIGSGRPGPITVALVALYDDVVRGREPRYRDWCLPVYGD
ncbi:MAG: branched-chain amino acid transaminase [Candidatus Eisenbacteria bacterium]